MININFNKLKRDNYLSMCIKDDTSLIIVIVSDWITLTIEDPKIIVHVTISRSSKLKFMLTNKDKEITLEDYTEKLPDIDKEFYPGFTQDLSQFVLALKQEFNLIA